MSSSPCKYVDYWGGDQTADRSCVWLSGCRSKSVGASLTCGLNCTHALPVTHNAAEVAVHYAPPKWPILCRVGR